MEAAFREVLQEFREEVGVPPGAKVGGTPKADEELSQSYDRSVRGQKEQAQWVEGVVKEAEAGNPVSPDTIKRLARIPAQQRQAIIDRIEAARQKGGQR
jgi:hypothetical protein